MKKENTTENRLLNTEIQSLIKKRKEWIEATEKNKFNINDLLSGMYTDPSHFVYELVQNAEDAEAKKIYFDLQPDQLEVSHDGTDFNFKNVDAISSIGISTKKDDLNKIGKFGVGFRSIFAITEAPEIYSGQFKFRIDSFVLPVILDEKTSSKTKFIFPLRHRTRTKDELIDLISNRLKQFGLRTLLFLKNIEEISWNIHLDVMKKLSYRNEQKSILPDSFSGTYTRTTKKIEGNYRHVHLSYKTYRHTEEEEEWLIFKRKVTANLVDVKVEIAYLLGKKEKSFKQEIIPATNTELFVFFPTEKETHLKFLIQGPYRTTPARDNIPYADDWNKRLINETATLIADSISQIKEMGLLNVDFLNILPIQGDAFIENKMFLPIYNAVKEKLSGKEALLPSDDNSYVPAAGAIIADADELRRLISSEQISLLFNKKNGKWINENITKDRTPELRQYLMQEIGILEIDGERFAKELTKEFLERQSDEWIKQFYRFLSHRNALWRKGGRNIWENSGLLRFEPIIRLEDGSHISPFDKNERPQAYLPSSEMSSDEINFDLNLVKRNIAEDNDSREFLINLGLKKPNILSNLIDKVLPEYTKKNFTISKEENILHVEGIVKILTSSEYNSDGRKHELLDKVRETPFLWSENIFNLHTEFHKPAEIYIGEIYTKDRTLETYFHGNDEAWFLDERYIAISIDDLKLLGCATSVRVHYQKSKTGFNVDISDNYGYHIRGLDRFDPNCEIDGLLHALKNITIERAKILWEILKLHHERIKGTVETSSRQDFAFSKKEVTYSKMGKMLTEFAWLPDKNGVFHRSTDIQLSNLHNCFEKESLEAKHIAEKLDFLKDAEQQLMDQLPEERKFLYELIKTAPEEKLKKIIGLLTKDSNIDTNLPLEEIYEKYKDALINEGSNNREDNGTDIWKGIHPDDEEKIRKEYGEHLLKQLQNPKIKTRTRIDSSTEIFDEDAIDPKEFLLEQYGGHCQICNIKLELGPKRDPYFDTCRILETHGRNWWTNNEFNVICLCPNCHALVKHGERNFNNILETAKKVSKNEISPEEVEERRGDYYIINIIVAGKQKEIYYSQKHMATIAAFIEKLKNNEE